MLDLTVSLTPGWRLALSVGGLRRKKPGNLEKHTKTWRIQTTGVNHTMNQRGSDDRRPVKYRLRERPDEPHLEQD